MPEKIINDDLIEQIRDLFDAQLIHPVEMIFFSKPEFCDPCKDTHQLLDEISSLSNKLHLSVYNLQENANLAQQYTIEHTPGLVIAARETHGITDYGIRFTGIPSGYEFTSLIQVILMVSKRDSGLRTNIREELNSFSIPVNLKVFVTPT